MQRLPPPERFTAAEIKAIGEQRAQHARELWEVNARHSNELRELHDRQESERQALAAELRPPGPPLETRGGPELAPGRSPPAPVLVPDVPRNTPEAA